MLPSRSNYGAKRVAIAGMHIHNMSESKAALIMLMIAPQHEYINPYEYNCAEFAAPHPNKH